MGNEFKCRKLIFVLVALMSVCNLSWAYAIGVLWRPVQQNDIEKTRTLIAAGANISDKDSLGNSVIHYAAAQGNVDMVVLLISKGADVNAKGLHEATPLHMAQKKKL
ncbi:MAG: ankyrin repeat domain-containing protein [Collimonas pratensis]|uniref:ankyrin repeat domain-containing protein n=1 Tax=Collimonas pratensis TaxID=279113 RepID=UPI003C711800